MLNFRRRLSAVTLSLALLPGNVVLCCAGWDAVPEAQMGDDCPMHQSDADSSSSQPVVMQARADDCCALSERKESSQPTPAFAPTLSSVVLGAAIALPERIPALVLRDAWRIAAPLPPSLVPKHVLLSVFLV